MEDSGGSQRGGAEIGAGTELLLDADQLVPLGEPLGAGHGPDLDLAGRRADGEIREE